MAASKVLDFVGEAHLDRLLAPLVADAADRAFVVRYLVGEGDAGGEARRRLESPRPHRPARDTGHLGYCVGLVDVGRVNGARVAMASARPPLAGQVRTAPRCSVPASSTDWGF